MVVSLNLIVVGVACVRYGYTYKQSQRVRKTQRGDFAYSVVRRVYADVGIYPLNEAFGCIQCCQNHSKVINYL